MKKRIVSAWLALCLLLGLAPTAAWAAVPMADGQDGYRETVETPPERSGAETPAEAAGAAAPKSHTSAEAAPEGDASPPPLSPWTRASFWT